MLENYLARRTLWYGTDSVKVEADGYTVVSKSAIKYLPNDSHRKNVDEYWGAEKLLVASSRNGTIHSALLVTRNMLAKFERWKQLNSVYQLMVLRVCSKLHQMGQC